MKDTTGKPRGRIPREELTAYERWELPLLDQQGNEIPVEEERDVKPLTAADIEAIRQSAREDGHAEGREAGFSEGMEEGRKKGYEEGHQTGLEEGRETGRTQGLEDTRQEVDSKLDRLEHLLGELLLPIERHQDETEASLVNLTTILSRAVIYRELSLDSSHIRDLVNRALASLPSTADNVRVRVHPDDAEWVREVAERFEAATSIVDDETILRGGCKLETRHSLVDFTVEKRFQKAVQGMLDQQLGSGESGDSEQLDAMMEDLTDFHRDVLESSPEPEPEPEPESDTSEPSETPDNTDNHQDEDDDGESR